MKKPNITPKIHTIKVKFFNPVGRMMAVTSIESQEIKAPKKTEKVTNPKQDLIIIPQPSLKLPEPLMT